MIKKYLLVQIVVLALTKLGFAQDLDTSLDGIPQDYTYDLMADRLNCIEQTVPLNFNEKVYSFINYFINRDRPYTREVIRKSSLYFPVFEKYLAKYDLPDELKYLSIVESGLNPQAISRAGAGGLWQFMPYTGRTYKLHQDWYIDERFDPEKATEAACKYLKSLYGMFGDWELALAAYNSGPGNVRRAIRRSGYKKKFWDIYRYLPRETRSYLPQFVAIVYTFHYASEHNLIPEQPLFMMDYDTVMSQGFLNLKVVANLLDICYEDVKQLNPALKRYGLKTSNGSYPVRVPSEKADYFRSHRESIHSNALQGKKKLEYLARNSVGSTFGRDKLLYRVRSGDVLGIIAQRYRVRISDIRKWNHLRGNLIRVGQHLSIWVYPGTRIAQRRAAPPKVELDLQGRKLHIVQPGDTLWDIARMYKDMNIEKLKKMNNLKSSKIKPGQKLIVG